ncbi:MAG: 50S ribosomal protein L35 [Micavibrio sp.]|nr:MAG: 50S ribosomal protein L35 [Micavibrio sp.]
MPKLKTKSSAKRRFSVTSRGKVKASSAYKRHMLQNKSKKMKRQARNTKFLCDPDARIVLRNFMPYARKRKKLNIKKQEVA